MRTTAQSTIDALITTRDLAARLYPASPRTIDRWRTEGRGPRYLKVGRRVYYRLRDVEAWLDAQVRTHPRDARQTA